MLPSAPGKREPNRETSSMGGAAESNAAILEKEREENEILRRIEIDKQYRLAVTEDESNEKRNVDYRLRIAIFYIYVDVLHSSNGTIRPCNDRPPRRKALP
jgi:hypothetical protein